MEHAHANERPLLDFGLHVTCLNDVAAARACSCLQLVDALPEGLQPSGAAAEGMLKEGKKGVAKVAQKAASAVGGAAHKVTETAKVAGVVA